MSLRGFITIRGLLNPQIVDHDEYYSPLLGDGYAVQIFTGPGYLYGLVGDNLQGTDRWLLVFDSLSTPTGLANKGQLHIKPNVQSSKSWPFPLHRLRIQNGLWIAVSTTPGYYTAGGTYDVWMEILFTKNAKAS